MLDLCELLVSMTIDFIFHLTPVLRQHGFPVASQRTYLHRVEL